MHINEILLNSTTRIVSYKNGREFGTGTGFFYHLAERAGKSIVGLVTNKHVIHDCEKATVIISVFNKDGVEEHLPHTIDLKPPALIEHPDPNIDLCALIVGPFLNEMERNGKNIRHAYVTNEICATEKTFSEILPLDEVTMIGYPIGIWDAVNNGSIARRGVIASNPRHNYEGRPEFIVDMACMPGSSGSPVFIANSGVYGTKKGGIIGGDRIIFLGVLWGGPQQTITGKVISVPVPMQRNKYAISRIPTNLGYIIKATELDPIKKLALDYLPKPLAKDDWS